MLPLGCDIDAWPHLAIRKVIFPMGAHIEEKIREEVALFVRTGIRVFAP